MHSNYDQPKITLKVPQCLDYF